MALRGFAHQVATLTAGLVPTLREAHQFDERQARELVAFGYLYAALNVLLRGAWWGDSLVVAMTLRRLLGELLNTSALPTPHPEQYRIEEVLARLAPLLTQNKLKAETSDLQQRLINEADVHRQRLQARIPSLSAVGSVWLVASGLVSAAVSLSEHNGLQAVPALEAMRTQLGQIVERIRQAEKEG